VFGKRTQPGKEEPVRIPTIETERLTLREFDPQDVNRLAAILSDPEVMRYMPGGEARSREQSEAAWRSIVVHWERYGFGWWAVVCKADANIIGWCGLAMIDEPPETVDVEVAYLLARPYWGRGIATEGAHASLRYGFEELDLDRIIALAFPENVASRRVMEKNGLVYEKVVHLWGLDLVQYAIARDAFRPTGAAYTLHRK
jgi:ribosomal-protein-alanine N-acetyltransferase